MQCFQKDPNLRVSARKLLKHPWIVNARRSDSVVPRKPTEYDEAVKSVQQWNEALKSPKAGSFRRASRPMSSSPGPGRHELAPIMATPARGSLKLAKPRMMTEQFRSPENTTKDNWDDDFVSTISPNALQSLHLRPHDNFGGLLSSEKLKVFASFETVTEETNWDENFEGDLTVKSSLQPADSDPLQTIRPSYSRHADIDKQSASVLPRFPEQKKPPMATYQSKPISGTRSVPKSRNIVSGVKSGRETPTESIAISSPKHTAAPNNLITVSEVWSKQAHEWW